MIYISACNPHHVQQVLYHALDPERHVHRLAIMSKFDGQLDCLPIEVMFGAEYRKHAVRDLIVVFVILVRVR